MEFSINKTTKKIRESYSALNAERQFITESEVRRFYDETSFTPKSISKTERLSLGKNSNKCNRCCSKCGNVCLSFPCGCFLFVFGLILASCYLWVPDEKITKISKVVVGDNSFGNFLHIHHILAIGIAFMFISIPCLCTYKKFCSNNKRSNKYFNEYSLQYDYGDENGLGNGLISNNNRSMTTNENNNSFNSLHGRSKDRSDSFNFGKDEVRNNNGSFGGNDVTPNRRKSSSEVVLF